MIIILVNNFKATKKYGFDGFIIIANIIKYFDKIITTPHILTEISNISNQIENRFKIDYFNTFFLKLEFLDELFIHANENFADEKVRKLGLTDAAIINLSKSKSYLVLTDDLQLYYLLSNKQIDVINFNHLLESKFS